VTYCLLQHANLPEEVQVVIDLLQPNEIDKDNTVLHIQMEQVPMGNLDDTMQEQMINHVLQKVCIEIHVFVPIAPLNYS
jgi:hypothetical protein